MSQEERRLKRKKKQRRKWFVVSIIIAFLLFRSVPSLFASTFKTTLPERCEIEEKIATEAIILRRESLYKAEGEGIVEIYVEHGERVAAGTKIAKITFLEDTSTLDQQLKEVEDRIQVLAQTEIDVNRLKEDENQLEMDIDSIIVEIQNSIATGDYDKTETLKDKLSIFHDKKRHIGRDNTLINQSLENLKTRREEIKSQIANNSLDYFSNEAGIVSFKIDGYEEIYSVGNKEEYAYSDFKNLASKERIVSNKDRIQINEPIFKIVDNFEWYMIIKIDDVKDITNYEEGDSILLTGEDIIGELRGSIEKININGTKGLILAKFNREFEPYLEKRYLPVDIIKFKHDGYKIPKKALVINDGIKGVYVKDISGIVKFVPVEIIREDEEFAYISQGDKNSNIDVKGKKEKLKTVKPFDEILLNTSNIKEGMIID
ncbi:MAG: hypothetical protein GXY96_02340 [Tissierellia bacterium]|nr:hypothetical protein [Tissierellia bacterium]